MLLPKIDMPGSVWYKGKKESQRKIEPWHGRQKKLIHTWKWHFKMASHLGCPFYQFLQSWNWRILSSSFWFIKQISCMALWRHHRCNHRFYGWPVTNHRFYGWPVTVHRFYGWPVTFFGLTMYFNEIAEVKRRHGSGCGSGSFLAQAVALARFWLWL